MHSQVCTIEAIADDANMNIFCKLANARHCVHSLLPPIKSCNHSLSHKGHIYELPFLCISESHQGCDSEMHKKSFVPHSLYKYM